MSRITTVATLIAALALVALLTTGALATTYTVTKVTALTTDNPYGWVQGSANSAKGGISPYTGCVKGNPGPAPMGSYYLQPGQSGGGSGNPGQWWLGTNRYEGIKLRDIQSLNYWAIVDIRGDENTSLLGPPDANGNRQAVANEWEPKWYSAQPPGIVLFIQISATNTNMRMLMWRGWDDGNLVGRGPKDGRYCRQWRNYDPKTSGIWYDPMGSAPKFYTWEQLLGVYGGSDDTNSAFLHAPAVGTTWGVANNPTGTSFNVEMGALKLSNTDFNVNGVDFGSWWMESWNGQAAVDLVKFAYYQPDNSVVDDTFDFQSSTTAPRVSALNCAGLAAGRYLYTLVTPNAWYPNYGPEPRTRKHYTGSALIPWGENECTDAASPLYAPNLAKQTALQRNAQYNRQLNVLCAKVVDKDTDGAPANPDGNYFYVTDGSYALATDGSYQPQFVKVSCFGFLPLRGQWLRMVGCAGVPTLWDWRYNMFHMRSKGDPNAVPPTQDTFWGPYETQFNTFSWNITRMDQ